MIQPDLLPTGWLLFRLDGLGFFQLPPGFSSESVPDNYIFEPEWNREEANKVWSEYLKSVQMEKVSKEASCPDCGSDEFKVHPHDFGMCRETGYRDAGERAICAKCGFDGDFEGDFVRVTHAPQMPSDPCKGEKHGDA